MTAYYNEIDPGAAAWLRELIKLKLIADGDVDERSILDVRPDELHGYTQCHFFAGIGVWSYALRLSGWPDDRPIWTGSCPCQPFSAAGQGKGFADERHLWPAFFHLIEVCSPICVFGEQVAGKDGLGWLDLVSTDLEGVGYACGAVPFPAAGIGAPHIRERLYWVADTLASGRARPSWGGSAQNQRTAECSLFGGLGDASQQSREWLPGSLSGAKAPEHRKDRQEHGPIHHGPQHAGASMGARQPGPTNGHWRTADWLGCRDGRWRPVEPGTSPLAHGAAARVGRLRGYGNAIVAQQAQAFIEAYLDAIGERTA